MDSKDLAILKLTIQNKLLTACLGNLIRKAYPTLNEQQLAEKVSELFKETETAMNKVKLDRIYHKH